MITAVTGSLIHVGASALLTAEQTTPKTSPPNWTEPRGSRVISSSALRPGVRSKLCVTVRDPVAITRRQRASDGAALTAKRATPSAPGGRSPFAPGGASPVVPHAPQRAVPKATLIQVKIRRIRDRPPPSRDL